ncbi:hypothetical protein AURDEDRAFT_159737 [Auricularia subglabra TFB-10046 SS5]|nr:hypothetical protein AURDEDRAFT_159737 [Auricularia subglabra TFB-10046 SS5]
MARLPEDVIYQIFGHLAPAAPQEPHKRWPFTHPALLAAPTRDASAAKNLRACALVCSVWSTVASNFNVRVLDVARPTRTTLTAALGTSNRCLLVHELALGESPDCEECRRRCQDASPCPNGIQTAVLLDLLARCHTLQRLNLREWAGDFDTFFTAQPTTARFESITQLRLGYVCDRRKMIPLRALCTLLRMLPRLKKLAFGDIGNTDEDISDIPPPEFGLETLAVSDARGINFRSYPWLFQNSGETLRTLWVYGVFGDAMPSLVEALGIVIKSLRSLHLFSSGSITRNYFGAFQDSLLNCSELQELTLGEIRAEHGYGDLLLPHAGHPRLQSLVLALAAFKAKEDGTASVPKFYDSSDLDDVAAHLLQCKSAYPKLRSLTLETYPSHPMDQPPVQALCQLRDVCQKNGLAFRFDRMCEIEP